MKNISSENKKERKENDDKRSNNVFKMIIDRESCL